MESASTINAWIEELASSLLPPSIIKSRQQRRKTLDVFRRRVRHQNYNRTNPFEVDDRLTGLEEKLQVLSRDDLSDALYKRRTELRGHYERWVPDVLDLLLRLSDDPANETELSDLRGASPSSELPALLKWTDIEANNPIDPKDPIWRIPNFHDSSSDDDDYVPSTATTSPASVKQKQHASVLSKDFQHTQLFEETGIDSIGTDLQHNLSNKRSLSKLTEIQMIRELLLVLQGFPSQIFEVIDHKILLDRRLQLNDISAQALQSLVSESQHVRNDLMILQNWIQHKKGEHYIQTIKQSMEHHIWTYLSSVSAIEESMLHPKYAQTASILSVTQQIESVSQPLSIIARWVQQVKDIDSVTNLDTLHAMVSECYFSGDVDGLRILLPIFVKAFDVYFQGPRKWLESGELSNQDSFFVQRKDDKASTVRVWHDWFELNVSGLCRAPKFLQDLVQSIFVCGKTSAFIRQLDATINFEDGHQLSMDIQLQLQSLANNEDIPFPLAFADVLAAYVSSYLASRTKILRHLLETRCSMSRTLDALETIYLRRQGNLLDTIESRIFSRIDGCMDNWNDRFLIADMLEDIYSGAAHIDTESITVTSIHTSSRSMESRRRSVRILSALAIDYTLPWPLANIIPKTSLTSYRKVSLHLLQIRRAKYILDRTAFLQTHNNPISTNIKDQQLAQTTTFMLVQFTNTLYDHFTTATTLPVTNKMRHDLQTAHTVDAMITVHASYISNLEFACLVSKPLSFLRDTLVGLLDMCIRFADLVCTPDSHAMRRRGSDDHEAGSFRSALSQHRKGRGRADTAGEADSSDDDDGEDGEGEGEGYSTFVVLDEDTSVVQEVRKLRTQFARQLDFFVAGLRGVAKGGSAVEEFEVLAMRLDWKSHS